MINNECSYLLSTPLGQLALEPAMSRQILVSLSFIPSEVFFSTQSVSWLGLHGFLHFDKVVDLNSASLPSRWQDGNPAVVANGAL